MKIEQFYNTYYGQIVDRLNGIIHNGATQNSLKEILSYHFKNPGKCFRSYLATNLALSFDSVISDATIDFATSVELIHNASLIHDDLQDQDFYRRGELNIWKKYSPSQAINTGDYLFTKAIEQILSSSLTSSVQVELLRRMAAAINELIQGQMLEISFMNTMAMTWKDWEIIASQKTGALIRLILEGTLLLAGKDYSTFSSEIEFIGKKLGILYQMRDDLLDATGKKEGRLRGSDIIEGKMTCLSIKAIEKNKNAESVVAEALLGRDRSDEVRVKQLIDYYTKEGIIDSVRELYQTMLTQCTEFPVYTVFPQLRSVINDFTDLLAVI
jgi:geranylgeranyl pyrophosphate synthase